MAKKTGSLVLEIVLAVGLFIVLASWLSIAFYLYDRKEPEYNKEYSIAQLGNVGSFFNVSTSVASFMTVTFVYFGLRLQKKELSILKEQDIKDRTIKEIEKWSGLRCNALNNEKSLEEIEKIASFFEWIWLINNSKLKDAIDLDLLVNVIINDHQAMTYVNKWVDSIADGIDNLREVYSEEIDLYFSEPHSIDETQSEGLKSYFRIKKINTGLYNGLKITKTHS